MVNPKATTTTDVNGNYLFDQLLAGNYTVTETQPAQFNQGTNAPGAFGTLGGQATSWDNRFAREGDSGYTAFADTGIHMIASDRPLEAMRAIDDGDGPGAPANACLTAHAAAGAAQ